MKYLDTRDSLLKFTLLKMLKEESHFLQFIKTETTFKRNFGELFNRIIRHLTQPC